MVEGFFTRKSGDFSRGEVNLARLYTNLMQLVQRVQAHAIAFSIHDVRETTHVTRQFSAAQCYLAACIFDSC